MAATKDSGFPINAAFTTSTTTTYSSSSFTTPGTDRMVVAVFMANGPTVVTADSVTSASLTWTKRVTAIDTGANFIVEIFTAPAASAVTGEVAAINWSGSHAFNRGAFIIFSVQGADTSSIGDTTVSAAGASGGDPSIALDATAADSYLIAGLSYRSSGSDTAVDGSTTSEYDAGTGGGFGFSQQAGSRASTGASSHTLGWTGDDVFGAWQAGAIEIKAAAGGGTAVKDLIGVGLIPGAR